MAKSIYLNPHTDATRLRDGAQPQGKMFWGKEGLRSAVLTLTNTALGDEMLLECCSIDEIDAAFYDGFDLDSLLLDAVTAIYSRLDNRMKALQRAINKGFSGDLTGNAAPIKGKVRKQGTFATITVQFPFSDGQVLSVIFHAPDGDPLLIKSKDTLVAFRWMLNKRDITAVVAPIRKRQDVSLKQIATRVSNLVESNSRRFVTAKEERDRVSTDLAKAKEQSAVLEENHKALVQQAETLATREGQLDNDILEFQELIAAKREDNEDLEDEIGLLNSRNSRKNVVDFGKAKKEKDLKGSEINLGSLDQATRELNLGGVTEISISSLVADIAMLAAMRNNKNALPVEIRRLEVSIDDQFGDINDALAQNGNMRLNQATLMTIAPKWVNESPAMAAELTKHIMKSVADEAGKELSESGVVYKTVQQVQDLTEEEYAKAHKALLQADKVFDAALLKAKRFGDADDVRQTDVLKKRWDDHGDIYNRNNLEGQIKVVSDRLNEKVGTVALIHEHEGNIDRLEMLIENDRNRSSRPNEFRRKEIHRLEDELAEARYQISTLDISEEDIEIERQHDAIEMFNAKYGWKGSAGKVFSDRVRDEIGARIKAEWEANPAYELGHAIIDELDGTLNRTFGDDYQKGEGTRLAETQMGPGTAYITFPKNNGENWEISFHYDEGHNSPFNDELYKSYPKGVDSKVVAKDYQKFLSSFETIAKTQNAPSYGSKYPIELPNGNWAHLADYKSAVREDIKAAKKRGDLPKELKTTVAGAHQSIRVNIKGLPKGFRIYNPEFVEYENKHPSRGWEPDKPKQYSREYRALEDMLEAIMDAYNYNNSDLDQDIHDTNFSSGVSLNVDSSEEIKQLESPERYKERLETAITSEGITAKALLEVLNTTREDADASKSIGALWDQAFAKWQQLDGEL